MAKTVLEYLKETGMTDEQIKAIDQKALDAMSTYVTQGNTALEKAAEERRLMSQTYDQEIAPGLAKWAERDTAISTELAGLRAWAGKVKDSGFVPKEILDAMPASGPVTTATTTTTATRGADGKFVAPTNGTVVTDNSALKKELSNELATAYRFMADTQWKYRSLFGQEMPDSPTALIAEANQNRMDPFAWAAKKYDFVGKEKTIAEAKQKAHDDAIRKEARESVEKEFAEKSGNNPFVRTPQESRFSEVSKAVAKGERKDPLKQTAEERKASTHANIQKEMQERSSMVQ